MTIPDYIVSVESQITFATQPDSITPEIVGDALTNLATIVSELPSGGTTDLTNYYTKVQTDNKYQIKGAYLTGVTSSDVTIALGYLPVSTTGLTSVSGLTNYYSKVQADNIYQPIGSYMTSGNYVSASTLSSYYTSNQTDAKILTGITFANIQSRPNTLSGYNIIDAVKRSDALLSTVQSFNVNSAPEYNTIASDVNAAVIIAPGSVNSKNIIGTTFGTGANLAAILGGYDQTNDALMGMMASAHSSLNSASTHASIWGGSYKNFLNNGSYSTSVGGTLHTVDGSPFSAFLAGYQLTANNLQYGLMGGQTNNAVNQKYGIVLGFGNDLTGATLSTSNNIFGARESTLYNTTHSTLLGSRLSSIGGGNYNYIGVGFTNKVGVTAIPQYSQILGGTLNTNDGTNSTIVNGSNNVIPSGLTNVYILGSAITATTSTRTYVNTLNSSTLTALGLVKADANKNLVTAVSNTDYLPVASPAMTGTPTAPTAVTGTSTTQIATTAFVNTATNNKLTLAAVTPVSVSSDNAVSNKVKVTIDGVDYYLLATTSAV